MVSYDCAHCDGDSLLGPAVLLDFDLWWRFLYVLGGMADSISIRWGYVPVSGIGPDVPAFGVVLVVSEFDGLKPDWDSWWSSGVVTLVLGPAVYL